MLAMLPAFQTGRGTGFSTDSVFSILHSVPGKSYRQVKKCSKPSWNLTNRSTFWIGKISARFGSSSSPFIGAAVMLVGGGLYIENRPMQASAVPAQMANSLPPAKVTRN
jgi:hypothetical protein